LSPTAQDDWKNYTNFTKMLGDKVQVVGDDLLVTNPTRVKKAIDEKACNALLLKVNQIGSVTESIEVLPQITNSKSTNPKITNPKSQTPKLP